MLAKRVFFSGRVQGVGFRYTAARIAGGFDVAGFVRNLGDGRVELVAEGPVGQVSGFLQQLKREMGGCIRSVDENEEIPAGCWHDFSIR